MYWSAPEVLIGGRHSSSSDCMSYFNIILINKYIYHNIFYKGYSIGILLWEIFHRQLPFGGKDPLQVAMEVVNSGNRPVMGAHIPRSMSDLITSCWSQDPAQRPTTQDIL